MNSRRQVVVIGNGLMAKAFSSYNDKADIIIFASGVSNSSTNDIKEFAREKKLLLDTIENHPNSKFIYFSSCDIICNALNERPYYKHKQAMESIVSENTLSYHIFRISQVVGKGGNINNLINFLILHIMQNKKFDLFVGSCRNVIDVLDMYKICNYLIENSLYENTRVNIINTKYISVEKLVLIIEKMFKRKAIYQKREVLLRCEYDSTISKEIASKIGIIFDDNYVENLIYKYYSQLLGSHCSQAPDWEQEKSLLQ